MYSFTRPNDKERVTLFKDDDNSVIVSGKQYNYLHKYLLARLQQSQSMRSDLHCKLYYAFAELHGLNYDPNDKIQKERRDARIEGRTAPLPKIQLQFANNQLDDATNSILEILFPSSRFYHAIAPKGELTKANALVKTLNREALEFKHYSEYARMVDSALKYNIFGLEVEWKSVLGKVPDVAETGGVTFNDGVIQEGNKLNSMDPYNLIWDPSVRIEDVATDAEFVGYFETESLFKLRRMKELNEVFGPKELRKTLEKLGKEVTNYKKDNFDKSFLGSFSTSTYYHEPRKYSPYATQETNDGNYLTAANISSFLGEIGETNQTTLAIGTCELTHLFIRLIPNEFGLSESEEFETWYFKMIGNHFIVYAQKVNVPHGRLPILLGTLGNDVSKTVQQSKAEKLFPYQNAASTLLDLDLEAQRKSIMGGKTFYNSNHVNMELVQDHTVADIPVALPAVDNPDIRRHVMQLSDIPQTTTAMNKIAAVTELAQDVLPTRQQKSVSDLQRATQYQAQASYHEASKTERAIARLIDTRVLIDTRQVMFFNELSFRESFTAIDENAQPIEIAPSEMLSVEFTLSQGLQSIDRFSTMSVLSDGINMVIQAQLQQQGVDVLGLVDYYTSLAGDETDLSRFRLAHQLDGLPTEQKDAILASLQQSQQQQPQ
jgi:hypothetical protein